MDDYTAQDFRDGVEVREWFDEHAQILLSRFFAVESGFGELT